MDRPPYIKTHGFSSQTADRWHSEVLPQHVRRMYEYADFDEGDITIEHHFEHEVYAWVPFIGCGADRGLSERNRLRRCGRSQASGASKKFVARAIAIARHEGGPAVDCFADWKPLAVDPSRQALGRPQEQPDARFLP